MISVINMTVYEKIKYLREKRGMSQQELANRVGFKTASAVNKIELGLRDINQNKILAFAKALETTPAYLLDDGERFKAPEVTSDVVVFKVIGTVAAGYDELALEDWSGETVSIPAEYLKGRSRDEFFVLSVHGDSMYPLYMNGDKVLILKQSTLNRSGEIGAVLYEGDNATLKKVEYVEGEDWMKLIPINPQYPPKTIEGSDLEQCRILGIPRLLIRELK